MSSKDYDACEGDFRDIIEVDTVAVEFTASPKYEDIDFLTKQINEETIEFGEAKPFAFYIRDEEKQIIAGCNGVVMYGSIYTDQLWVDKKHRHQGYAKQLMTHVHQYGKNQGCNIATVMTMSFQGARSFYEKLGYHCDCERSGYVRESEALFLVKKL